MIEKRLKVIQQQLSQLTCKLTEINSANITGGGGGDSTDVTELLQNISNSNNNLLTLIGGSARGIQVEQVLGGADDFNERLTDPNVQSVALTFLGEGGTIDGVPVGSNFNFSFSPNKGADTVDSIVFTPPTTGEARVIITYVR